MGTFKAVRVDLKLFTAVFCFTQLASSIAVPGVPLYPQEELMVTREHQSVPFWDPISQPVVCVMLYSIACLGNARSVL